MIIREFLNDPISEISSFDFYNDYKDTYSWLINNAAPKDVINLLEAAEAVWFRQWQDAFKAK